MTSYSFLAMREGRRQVVELVTPSFSCRSHGAPSDMLEHCLLDKLRPGRDVCSRKFMTSGALRRLLGFPAPSTPPSPQPSRALSARRAPKAKTPALSDAPWDCKHDKVPRWRGRVMAANRTAAAGQRGIPGTGRGGGRRRGGKRLTAGYEE